MFKVDLFYPHRVSFSLALIQHRAPRRPIRHILHPKAPSEIMSGDV